jgi:hypothetical protein
MPIHLTDVSVAFTALTVLTLIFAFLLHRVFRYENLVSDPSPPGNPSEELRNLERDKKQIEKVSDDIEKIQSEIEVLRNDFEFWSNKIRIIKRQGIKPIVSNNDLLLKSGNDYDDDSIVEFCLKSGLSIPEVIKQWNR